jgi:hypothetical protein
MKKNKHDFDSLMAEIFRANVHDVGSEPAVIYCIDYPQALAMAIEQRDYAGLIKLLDAKEPIHPCLCPALATAIRAQEQGKVAGNKRTLTTVEIDAMVSLMKQMLFHNQKAGKIQGKISTALPVNIATVKRVWEDIKPKSRSRCTKPKCPLCEQFAAMPDHLK